MALSMATAHHPRALSTRRSVTVGILVLGLVLALTLNPDSTKVEASGLFGGLRSPGEPSFIVPHRGDRTVAPENTMPALQAALDGPMAYVEADIQLTRDLVPVLMHDTWVDRTTNGTGRLTDLTFAQVRQLDAGAWYSPAFAGTRVPTLEALLSALQVSAAEHRRPRALLELKGFWSVEEVRIVTDLIAQYDVGRLIILSSFDPVTLQHAQEADETIPRAAILRTLPNDPVGFARRYGAVAIITSHAAVEADRWVVDRVHRAGLGILLYTLNTKAYWSSALTLGVDGIITDRPHRLDTWMSAKTQK